LRIPAKFVIAQPFSVQEKLAVVKEGDKYHYIDPEGNDPFNQSFDFAGVFRGGVARVKKGGKFALLDKHGKALTDPVYDELGDLREGLIRARREGRSMFLAPTGQEVFRVSEAEAIGDRSGGRVWYRRAGKYGYLDGNTGRVIIEPKFEAAGDYSAGKAAVRQEGKFGYINMDGEFVIRPQFQAARMFHGKVAVVQSDGKFGVINDRGSFALNAEYDEIDIKGPNVAARKIDVERFFIVQADGSLKRAFAGAGNLARVAIKSQPPGAEIYRIPLYDADGVTDIETLLTWDNRLPEGNTDAETQLDKYTVWVIVVVLTDPASGKRRIERRLCSPSTNPQIVVMFQ
jgi:hypothetical protein